MAMAWKNAPVTRPRRPPVCSSARPSPSAISANGSSLPGGHERGVMEFVAADDGAAAAENSVGEKPRSAIAEMQLALGEARRSGRAIRSWRGADRPCPRCFRPKPCSRRTRHAPDASRRNAATPRKISRSGERLGVQFRIAARQPAAVGVFRRRLVGERREWQNLGAGITPSVDRMWIDEAEGAVAGERDALAGRRQVRAGAAPSPRTAIVKGAALAMIASRSKWRSAVAARRSISAARSACSPA